MLTCMEMGHRLEVLVLLALFQRLQQTGGRGEEEHQRGRKIQH